MKNINKSFKLIALLFVCLAIPALAKSQAVNNMYFNLNWQVNTPVSQSYADKTSGWGAEGEAGYYVCPNFGLGLFLAYHTNNKYIGTETMEISATEAITSDQQHCLFQMPFGLTTRYNIVPESQFQPYIGLKLGTEYSKTSSYMNVYQVYDKSWGFYLAPEVGMTLYFTPEKQIGANIAFYYSYATNDSKLLIYKEDGLNNWGFRVGLAF